MIAQDFPQTPLRLPTASLPPEPVNVDLRPILEALTHEYRLAAEWGHHERAAAYREVLREVRAQFRKEAARQHLIVSNFVPPEE